MNDKLIKIYELKKAQKLLEKHEVKLDAKEIKKITDKIYELGKTN